MKKTKIVATLGPATNSPEMIKKLVLAGVNVFRVNASHGDLSGIEKMISRVRRVEKTLDTYLAVLLDLQGPKIRIGKFENGFIEISRGDRLVFTTEKIIGNNKIIPIQYQRFHHDVNVGNRILLDDGNLTVQVKKIDGKKVTVEVLNGGTLSDNKGLNLPEGSISASPITKKDKECLKCGLQAGVDFVALSFVRNAKEIRTLRRLIREEGYGAEIIAKIERHEAVKNLDAIINEADGLMVARGDMGVEIPFEQVPIVQRDILKRANRVGKPVIIATQMLESMIQNPRATRAEISDVANGVSYYTDAVMLSAETAVGAYPIEAVKTMTRTALTTEDYQYHHHSILQWRDPKGAEVSITRGVTYAANQLAEVLKAKAILAFTESGETVRQIIRPRPNIPVFAFTTSHDEARRLCVLRGVYPFWIRRAADLKEPLKFMFGLLKDKGLIKKGDRVILTSGLPMRASSATNMVRVETVC